MIICDRCGAVTKKGEYNSAKLKIMLLHDGNFCNHCSEALEKLIDKMVKEFISPVEVLTPTPTPKRRTRSKTREQRR